MSLKINWDEVVKKKARGNNDYDFGEVDAVQYDTVVTKKEIIDKDKFYLLKALVESYDGNKPRLKITKEDAKPTSEISNR